MVKPIELGADVVVNSSSKYMNGNSNAISGVLIFGGKFQWDERYPGVLQYKRFGDLAFILSNIGDTRTLVIHPASTIAVHLSKEAKEAKEMSGVYEDLIRISVGIENIEDLKQDFAQAIEKSK